MGLRRETYLRWLAVAGIALVAGALIALVANAGVSRSPVSPIVSAPVARTSAVPSQQTAAGPGGRAWAAAAFYPPSHALVLFGGRTGFDYGGGRPGVSNETWTWDGSSWHQLHPVNSPPARYGAGLVYDSVNKVLALYGGTDGLYCCVDTWTWDGTNWKQMSPATSPPQWPVATMAYDSVRKAALLYLVGTFCPPKCVSPNQTWSWDGSTWSQIVTSTTPDPDGQTNGGLGGVLAFDATSGQTLYVGQSGTWTLEGATTGSSSARTLIANRWVKLGAGGTDTRAGTTSAWVGFAVGSADTHLVEVGAYSDTWVWNGSAWTVQNPAVAPPPRTGEALAFDPERRVVILFGGAVGNGAQSTGMNDTWAWDGTVWKQVA